MSAVGSLVTILLIQLITATSFHVALRREGLRRWIVFVPCFLTVILIAPLQLDPGMPRWLCGVWACQVGFKLIDVNLSVRPGDRPSLGAYVEFLINPLWMVFRQPPRRTLRSREVPRLARRLIATAIAIVVLAAVWRANDHGLPRIVALNIRGSAIAMLFVVFANCWASIWRLCGGVGIDPMDQPYLARTPAEFWRRWNRPTQQLFRVYVFGPAGGLRHPIRATLATFLVSALAHEWLFSFSAGRFQGYQLAFFLLNGIASAATIRLKPTGVTTILSVIATLAFTLCSATLFYASFLDLI